jgi:multidrug efflux pump subunit AcrB
LKGIIAWFANNGVAANFMAILIVAGGLMSMGQIKKEVFPEMSSDMIEIQVLYPGAAPEEVEKGICIKIEESVQSIAGVKKITSTAAENVGMLMLELLPGEDAARVLDEVKARVDAIDTFPVEAEKPVVNEAILRRQVLNVAISGRADELTLKKLGERVRDEISSIPGVTQVQLANVRPYEISIEVSENSLRQYGLTFEEVALAVRRSSLDLPGGSVKTRGGEILFRTQAQAYRGHEFENILVRSAPDGSQVYVRDVATVVDGFADVDNQASFGGEPAVLVQVFRVGEQSALEISDKIEDYIRIAEPQMPAGISLTVWQNDANFLRGRLDVLVRNGIAGLCLVLIVLTFFLRLRLAIWVAFGILISFLGTFFLMPLLGVSINMISLFAFVLVLGIVVDDAIVVSENIYTHQKRGEDSHESSVAGAQEVVKPVIFAVLTTIAAFAPLMLVPGNTGKVMKVIPMIVIPTLLFSLVESLLVLPSHLGHLKPQHLLKLSTHRDPFTWFINFLKRIVQTWRNFQTRFSDAIERFVEKGYRPLLFRALEWRYLTVSIALFCILFTAGLVGGKYVQFQFFPPVEGDNVAAFLTMPQGTPAEVTAEAIRKIEESAMKLSAELDAEHPEMTNSVIRYMLASVGEQPFLTAQQQGVGNYVKLISAAHLGEVNMELVPSEERGEVSSADLANRWRELTGDIPDAVELSFSASIFSPGAAVNLQLAGTSMERLSEVADQVKSRLAQYEGVFDITDSFRAGKQELKLTLKPAAESLGVNQQMLARQVRQAFYGEEAQRIQRGRDDVKVMVRYPDDERRSLADLENMRVRTVAGAEVPFSEVAEVEFGRGYANITRVDRRRSVNVTADVDSTKANAADIVAEMEKEFLPQLMADYPGTSYSFEGERREQQETMGGVFRGLVLAMLIIYALLAIPFKSYVQPLIVMCAIPFGMVGAVWGHLFLGMDLTVLSMFGIVALAGVVVNDSLVMVDFINREVEAGDSIIHAIRHAGAARFRPIMLTSVTTFAGLTPLLLEKSLQAKFLIPMGVSLGFGVMFATFITLLIVPCGYLILEDIKAGFKWLYGHPEDSASALPAQAAVLPDEA